MVFGSFTGPIECPCRPSDFILTSHVFLGFGKYIKIYLRICKLGIKITSVDFLESFYTFFRLI